MFNFIQCLKPHRVHSSQCGWMPRLDWIQFIRGCHFRGSVHEVSMNFTCFHPSQTLSSIFGARQHTRLIHVWTLPSCILIEDQQVGAAYTPRSFWSCDRPAGVVGWSKSGEWLRIFVATSARKGARRGNPFDWKRRAAWSKGPKKTARMTKIEWDRTKDDRWRCI